MMRRMCRLAGILALVFSFSSIEAQHASETFGRNRIQYKDFDWKYLSSENFDVYFYGERRKKKGNILAMEMIPEREIFAIHLSSTSAE